MGAAGAAFSREPGQGHGGQPARGRNQRRPGPGARRRPARRHDRRHRSRLWLQRGRGRSDGAALCRGPAGRWRRCHRQAFPRSRCGGRVTPTSPCSASTCSKPRLRRVDERPYRRFSSAGGGLVMLSTAIYPAFSPRPAAFARTIATGELRRRLGFEGVSITDALESAAVSELRRSRRGGAGGDRGRNRPPSLHRLPRRRRRRAGPVEAPARCPGRPGRPSKPQPAGSCACATPWRLSAARRR